MIRQSTYTNLNEALESLQFLGYTANISLRKRCLKVRNGGCKLKNEDFQVDELHHLQESCIEPGHTALYAISSQKFKVKGVMIVNLQYAFRKISSSLAASLKIKQ